jgi:uncharacterized membrane protein SpoIIM required for sporulation
MVLESIISPERAEKEPWELFFVGALYSSIAIFLSLFIFGEKEISLVMVFLTVLAATILMYQTLKFEEKKDESLLPEKTLLREHSKALLFFTFLFMGLVVSFALWYVFLPDGLANNVYSTQISAINAVNNIQGQAVGTGTISRILANNLKVLFFSLFFSFFYGMGAIFILTWNASVVGAATGMFISNALAAATGSHFTIITLGLTRYLIHGIPEVGAYFVGGLAGGIISVAIIQKTTSWTQFRKVLGDAGWLVLVAVVMLILSALLEVYVTPIFF